MTYRDTVTKKLAEASFFVSLCNEVFYDVT